MLITSSVMSEIMGRKENDNIRSMVEGLKIGGKVVGLDRPHRFAMFCGQVGHESAGGYWDREIWGPTTAQKGYEGRADLGNIYAGDGKKFMGRGPIQITGRYNTTQYYNWCKATFTDMVIPDFVGNPDLINTDPWEGVSPLWYWAFGKSVSLNVSADKGDFVTNTKLVNGGTNGLADRYNYYGRAALVLLGYAPTDLKAYQSKYGLTADGIMGAKTQAVMHSQLLLLDDLKFNEDTDSGNGGTGDSVILAFLKQLYDLIGSFLNNQGKK